MLAHMRCQPSTGNAFEKQALDPAHLVWKQAWKHIGQALLERRQLREKAKAKAANQGPGNLTVNESKGGVVNQREACKPQKGEA